jgi:hypothetical protein
MNALIVFVVYRHLLVRFAYLSTRPARRSFIPLVGAWAGFIARSWAGRDEDVEMAQDDIDSLVSFIRYTAARYDADGFRSAEEGRKCHISAS